MNEQELQVKFNLDPKSGDLVNRVAIGTHLSQLAAATAKAKLTPSRYSVVITAHDPSLDAQRGIHVGG